MFETVSKRFHYLNLIRNVVNIFNSFSDKNINEILTNFKTKMGSNSISSSNQNTYIQKNMNPSIYYRLLQRTNVNFKILSLGFTVECFGIYIYSFCTSFSSSMMAQINDVQVSNNCMLDYHGQLSSQ